MAQPEGQVAINPKGVQIPLFKTNKNKHCGATSLDRFPQELLIAIFKSLALDQQARVSGVCKAFHNAIKSFDNREAIWEETVTRPAIRFSEISLAPRIPFSSLSRDDFDRRLVELSKVESTDGDHRDPYRRESFANALCVDAELYSDLYEAALVAYTPPRFWTREALFGLITRCFALDGWNNTYTWGPAAHYPDPVVGVSVSVGLNRKPVQMLSSYDDPAKGQDATTLTVMKFELNPTDPRYSTANRWLYNMTIDGTRITADGEVNRSLFWIADWVSPSDVLHYNNPASVKALLEHAFTGMRDELEPDDPKKYFLPNDEIFAASHNASLDGLEDEYTEPILYAPQFCARLVCSSLIFNDENKTYTDEYAECTNLPRLRAYDVAC